ncbi:MAG: putative tryptophan/tyrosine transport system substrate-binding protein [Candidatus Dependentiae bacterium]|nr:putative tryptophan/tyrosine transport system substrate-binding protein [Candidatus Dependentiae bacterium]
MLYGFKVFLGGMSALVVAACLLYVGSKQPSRVFNVLLLYANTVAYHEIARNYFMEAVQEHRDARLSVKLLSAPNATDKIAIAAVCETALGTAADCIVVVGRNMSQLLVHLAMRKKIHTPIIFLAVERPVELGMVQSLEHPGGDATGVFTAGLDGFRCGMLLRLVCPQVHSVLLPYSVINDIDGAVQSRATEVKQYLEARGVRVDIAALDTPADALKRIQGLLSRHDMLLTLEGDDLNGSIYQGLARLAYKRDIGFFSGYKWALAEGALFTYAVEPRYVANAAFELVKQILYYGAHPSTMQVVSLASSREFIINQKRAAELGLTIDVDAVIEKINVDPDLECVRGRVRVV